MISKMHGRGKFTFPNGKYYEGEFVENTMHGKGIMSFGFNKLYRGEWKAGAPRELVS
jgi:hypothetical protein